MSKKKKFVLFSVSAVLVAAIVIGLTVVLPKLNRKPVDVFVVERFRDYSWSDQFGSYGNIMAANVQNVYLDAELLLSSVDVAEGQEVKTGDVLMRYDMTIQNLQMRTIQIAIDILDSKLKKAEQALADAKALSPSEPLPPLPEPEELAVSLLVDDKMATKSAGGTGTAEDPIIYNCMMGSTVTPDFLKKMYSNFLGEQQQTSASTAGNVSSSPTTESASPSPSADGTTPPPSPTATPAPTPRYYRFNVYYGNFILMYRWTVDAFTLNPDDEANKALFESGWNLSDGVLEDDDGGFDIAEMAGKYQAYAAAEKLAETLLYDPIRHYTQKEIDGMIRAAENDITTFTTDRKMRRLELEEATAKAGDGTIKSEIDGIVSTVEDPDSLEQGAPLIVVQSESGYRVEGSVSELNRGRVSVGQEVTVSSWQTGGSYSGVIKEIMEFPARYAQGSTGMENPLNSYYTFVVTISTDEMLIVGDWVEIQFAGGGTEPPEDVLYLPNAYIRETDGRSYVMKADENGNLVRQFVSVGKSNYGYSTEIRTGLLSTDHIAFPYGKNVVEGAPTVVSDGPVY